jgi:hypothetical protein
MEDTAKLHTYRANPSCCTANWANGAWLGALTVKEHTCLRRRRNFPAMRIGRTSNREWQNMTNGMPFQL